MNYHLFNMGLHVVKIPEGTDPQWLMYMMRECMQETLQDVGAEVIESHHSGLASHEFYWKIKNFFTRSKSE